MQPFLGLRLLLFLFQVLLAEQLYTGGFLAQVLNELVVVLD
jgi:hypothetical protein